MKFSGRGIPHEGVWVQPRPISRGLHPAPRRGEELFSDTNARRRFLLDLWPTSHVRDPLVDHDPCSCFTSYTEKGEKKKGEIAV